MVEHLPSMYKARCPLPVPQGEKEKQNIGGNQKSSHVKWVSSVSFILSYATDVGLQGWKGYPVSGSELSLGSALLSLLCGSDAVTFASVPLGSEYILMTRE